MTPDLTATLPPAAIETATVLPTQAAGRVILLAPPDALQTAALKEILGELASSSGFEFEALAAPPDAALDPSVKIVVAAAPAPGFQELAAANPQIQFLALGIPDLTTGGNLSVLGAGGRRPDQQGFIAGFLAATITPDWRAGVISAPKTSAGKAARNGFANGLVFFCGLCRPAYPPFVQYPVFADLPAAASSTHLQAAVDLLAANAVKTAYVAPEAVSAEILENLAAAGMQIIASGAPPDAAAASWIASVDADELAALRQIWPELIAGGSASDAAAPLALTHVNSSLLSPGRQRLVEDKIADLSAGFIDTGIDPQTGDPR